MLQDCPGENHATTIFKPAATGRKAPKTVTLETSPYRDHFDFVADCVLCRHESRPQFFKILAAVIEEYKPATFVESTLVASLATYRWRQLRFCGMFAGLTSGVTSGATASEESGRTSLLALLARQERHCKRLYNRTRKLLLEVLSTRVNHVGGPTHPPAAAAAPPKKRKTTRAAAAAGSNLRVFPKAGLPIAS